jgi:hypothetical protein
VIENVFLEENCIFAIIFLPFWYFYLRFFTISLLLLLLEDRCFFFASDIFENLFVGSKKPKVFATSLAPSEVICVKKFLESLQPFKGEPSGVRV